MSKIINRERGSVTNFQRVDTHRLGAVILVDDVRPAMDRTTGVQTDRGGVLEWVATVQVPGVRTRDYDGFAEIPLRIVTNTPAMLSGPMLIELDEDTTVSATVSRNNGGRSASVRMRTAGVRASQRDVSDDLNGIPILIGDGGSIAWLGAGPKKGFDGQARVDGQLAWIAQVLVDRTGTDGQGVEFTQRESVAVELLGAALPTDLRTLQRVEILNPAVHPNLGEDRRTASLLVCAARIRPAAEAPAPPAPKHRQTPKEEIPQADQPAA